MLREHKQKIEDLPQELPFIRVCSDAGFMETVTDQELPLSTVEQEDHTRKEAVKKLIHQFETHLEPVLASGAGNANLATTRGPDPDVLEAWRVAVGDCGIHSASATHTSRGNSGKALVALGSRCPLCIPCPRPILQNCRHHETHMNKNGHQQ